MNQAGNLNAFLERSSSLYYILLNTEGCYLYANNLYRTIFRLNGEQAGNKPFRELFTQEYREALDDSLAEAARGAQSVVDLNLRTPDGSEFWTRWEFSPYYDDQQQLAGFQGIGNDISERKRAELEKKRVQEYLQIILNNSEEAFILLNESLDILTFNAKANEMVYNIFGVHLKTGLPILLFESEEYFPIREKLFESVLAGQAAEYEQEFTLKDGSLFVVQNSLKAVTLEPGSKRGIILTSRDITARKLAQLELINTRNYFKAIIEKSSDGLLIIRNSNEVFDLSPAATRILGFSSSELTALDRRSLVHPDDLSMLQAAFFEVEQNDSVIRNIEFRVLTDPQQNKKEYKWLSATIQNLYREPSIQGMVVHFNDITDRKEAVNALLESEEKYRFLFVSNPQPMWIFDEHTLRILEVNEAAIAHYGYSQEEFRSMTLKNIRPEDDVDRLYLRMHEVRRIDGIRDSKQIWRHRKKNGEIIFVEVKSHKVQYLGYSSNIVSINDITKMVEAEQELIKSNERFRYAMKATSEVIWEYDFLSSSVYRSDSFRQIFGLDEAQNYSFEDFVQYLHPDDLEKARTSFLNALNNPEVETWEEDFRVRKQDGEYVFISDKAYIIRDQEGKAVRVVGSMRDITERKRFEAELIASKERFEFVGKATSDAIWDADLITGFVYWGPNYKTLFGYDIPERATMTLWLSRVHPEDVDMVIRSYEAAAFHSKTITNWKQEYRFYRADGTIAYIVDKGVIMRDENGNAYRMIGAMQDITEIKEAEKELAMERNLLRTLIDHIPDYIFVKDKNLRHIINNQANIELIGAKSEAETIGKKTVDYFGDAAEHFEEVDRRVLKTGETIVTQETLLGNQGNEHLWLLTTKVPLKNASNEVIGIVGVSRNITELKRIEESLRKINERYLIVSKATNDAVWDLDVSASSIIWNEGLRTIFGFPFTETSLDWWTQQIHPDDFNRVMSLWENMFEEKESTWYSEYRFKANDGQYRFILDRGYVLFDQHDRPYRVIGAMMDITDRKRLQDELEKQKLDRQRQITEATIRAQEKERRELGRELHDNINQILTTSKIYIEMAMEEPEIREEVLGKSYQYVSNAIDEIRSLSKSLVPPSLGDIGLKEAITDLINNLNQAQKIHIIFKTYGLKGVFIDNDLKLMTYRIVQEQINNVLKHSKASSAEISISVVRKNLNIIIRDDGIGFDQARRGRGIGLNNIMSRAELHHGSVLIDSSPGNGCSLKVSIPIK